MEGPQGGPTGESNALGQTGEACPAVDGGEKGRPANPEVAAEKVEQHSLCGSAGWCRANVLECPGAIHQRAELHQGRTGGLAGPALQAAAEMGPEAFRVVQPVPDQPLYQGDAPTWRLRLVGAQAVSGAVRKAEAALDALICGSAELLSQVLLVQLAVPLLDGRRLPAASTDGGREGDERHAVVTSAGSRV